MSQIKAYVSRFMRPYLLASLGVCVALLSATAPHTLRSAAAQGPLRITPPPWPSACLAANGNPVVPAIASGYNYAWSFIANFDHTPSQANTVGCFTELVLTGTSPVLYVSLVSCPIQNNLAIPRKLIGGGSAVFDGNLYVTCTLTLPAAHQAGHFYIRARALLPVAGVSYTLMASTPATFTAQLDAACNLTLNSTYVSTLNSTVMQYTNAAGSARCNTLLGISTRIQPTRITHMVNGALVTPAHMPSLRIGIPMTYTFQIGAAGQAFTLDEFVVDPQPLKCCTPG